LRACLDLDSVGDASCETGLRLDAGVFDKSSLELALDDKVGRRQSLVDITARHPSAREHIAGAIQVWMDLDGAGSESLVNCRQRRQNFPRYRKAAQVDCFDDLRFPDDDRHGFTAKPGLVSGKHGLVGEGGNHAIAIHSRDIVRGEDRGNPRMRFDKRVQVSELKASPVVGVTDRTDGQGVCRSFICTEHLGTVDLSLTIESDEPLSNRLASLRA
jgi:hypothetical protein